MACCNKSGSDQHTIVVILLFSLVKDFVKNTTRARGWVGLLVFQKMRFESQNTHSESQRF